MTVVRRTDDTICEHPGCITRLCSYNEGPTCFVHRPQTRTAHRQLTGQLERQRAWRELQTLMAQDGQRIAA